MDRSKRLAEAGEEESLTTLGVKQTRRKDCRPEQRYAYRNGGAKLSGSIVKELSRKPDVFRNLADFQPKGGLQQKEVVCGPSGISVEFSSPLKYITSPQYIQQHKREDLINDRFPKDNDEDVEDHGKSINGQSKSTVIGVDCKWKSGIKLTNAINRSRSREINPTPKVIDFDFESKMKFSKEMDQIWDEYFPQDNVLILEGNKIAANLKYSSHSPEETEVEAELGVPLYYDPTVSRDKHWRLRPGTKIMDPFNVENKEYNDLEEHKILLIPSFTKTGFDVNTTQFYRFPYTAKFSVGSKKYERSLELQLPLSKSPQHFGLIFTFPEISETLLQINTIIKSMISIYTVFPQSSRHATLTVYEFPDLPITKKNNGNISTRICVKEGRDTKGRLIANDYLSAMKDDLVEEKLVPNGWAGKSFVLSHQIKGKHLVKEHFIKPTNKFSYEYNQSKPDGKNKSKQKVLSHIQLERES